MKLSGFVFVQMLSGHINHSLVLASLHADYVCLSRLLQLQVPLAESVCGRWRHSVSAVQLGLHCVWLIIFGGYCYIANTAIVELCKL